MLLPVGRCYIRVKMGKIGYSLRTFGYTKYVVKDEIIKALESDSEIRGEMRSIMSTANKRISRLQQGNIVSPALQSLSGKKFTMQGSWEEAKREYARAISFLQQPTSTVTGAREYGKYIQRSYGLSDEEYNKLGHDIVNKVSSVDEENFYNKYLKNYKDFSGELEQAAKDVSQQIEDDAKRVANAVQDNINKAGEQGEKAVNDAINDILMIFDDFGL